MNITIKALALVAAAGGAAMAASPGQALRAAAEPFETLTETAFDAPLPTLDRTIAQARATAAGIGRAIPAETARQLDGRLAEIDAARARQDRAALALSSVEGFRLLVGAVPADAKVPAGVDVLDYAGMRYDADRRARPVRWDDMSAAAAVARETWDALSPQVRATPVQAAFGRALNGMDRAVAARDAPLAATQVHQELDLVDRLETVFGAR